MLAQLGLDECHRAFAGRAILCLFVAAVLAVLMLWLSASQLRRRPLRRVELCLLLALGVGLVVWAARQVASEPVLVSGHLNLGMALGLAFFSLWLAFLGVRARKRGPRSPLYSPVVVRRSCSVRPQRGRGERCSRASAITPASLGTPILLRGRACHDHWANDFGLRVS